MRSRPPFGLVPMLTPEKPEQVRRAGVEHNRRNLERLKTIGAGRPVRDPDEHSQRGLRHRP